MQRPELPQKYKKVTAIFAIMAMVLIMTRHIDAVPAWINPAGWIMFGLLELYILYWAMRQACWSYAALNIGIMLAIGITYLLIIRAPSGASVEATSGSSIWQDIALWATIVIVIAKIAFESVAVYYILRHERYPDKSASMRRLFWPVNIVMDIVIIALIVATLYA